MNRMKLDPINPHPPVTRIVMGRLRLRLREEKRRNLLSS
jgi:hypothetical protein